MASAIRLRALWFILGAIFAGAAGVFLASPGAPEPGPKLPSGFLIGRRKVAEKLPEVPERPPDIHASGTVIWKPTESVEIPPAEPGSPQPFAPTVEAAAGGCDFGKLTVQAQCAFDAFAAGEPWGRLRVNVVVREGNRGRAFPPQDAGEIDFRVAPKLEPRRLLPWLLEGRALVVGPDPGFRLGATWFSAGRRIGVSADLDRRCHDFAYTTGSSSYENLATASIGACPWGAGIGIAFRLGPS